MTHTRENKMTTLEKLQHSLVFGSPVTLTDGTGTYQGIVTKHWIGGGNRRDCVLCTIDTSNRTFRLTL